MDLLDLRLLVAVADAGSITHGAAVVHLSLPSASARVRAVERSVGAPLFDRDRRGVVPTTSGRVLLRHAREICASVDRLDDELSEHAEGHAATVTLLANTGAIMSLGGVLTTFLADHPRARIDLDERPSAEIVATVARGGTEIGIVADTVDLGRLRRRHLRPDPLVLVTAADDDFVRRGSVAFADVIGRSFVGLGGSSALHDHLEGHALPLGSRPTYRVRLPSVEAVLHAVAHRLGVTVLPRRAVEDSGAGQRVRMVGLEDDWADRNLVACTSATVPLTNTADALLEHIAQTFADPSPARVAQVN